jgi:predicted nucleotidyltransferase
MWIIAMAVIMLDLMPTISPRFAVPAKIDIDRRAISEFCSKYGIKKIALFGSSIRDDFGADSDIDVLVEFETNAIPGLNFFAMEDELSALMGRPVDLNTLGFLSAEIRGRVLSEAETQYERG